MATTINAPLSWAKTETPKSNISIINRLRAFADGQAKNKLLWFLVSLIVQGVFFLPLPAVLSYYFNAPVFLLAITLPLFFANVITGMGGSGIRTTLFLFALSVLTHMCMVLIYIW